MDDLSEMLTPPVAALLDALWLLGGTGAHSPWNTARVMDEMHSGIQYATGCTPAQVYELGILRRRQMEADAARIRELEALVEQMPVAIIEPGEAGLFHATSPDIPGLFVSGESVAEVRAAIPVVARALLARMGGEHDRS